MSIDIRKMLDVLEASSRVLRAGFEVAEDAIKAASPVDQADLRVALARLREENERGYFRLDEKLAAKIRQGQGQ